MRRPASLARRSNIHAIARNFFIGKCNISDTAAEILEASFWLLICFTCFGMLGVHVSSEVTPSALLSPTNGVPLPTFELHAQSTVALQGFSELSRLRLLAPMSTLLHKGLGTRRWLFEIDVGGVVKL